MGRKLFVISLSTFAFFATGCSRPTPNAPVPEAHATPPASSREPEAPIDACSLLTSEEIKTVMGEAVAETKSERKATGGFRISLCYFALPTPAKAISLRLVQSGTEGDARSAREAWQKTFGRELDRAVEGRGEGISPPERVPGVGDEAFWTGGAKSGGLYVLKGNRYFRLGVGGEPNQPIKIEKAKKLAASILPRL